jgi:cytochrome P450
LEQAAAEYGDVAHLVAGPPVRRTALYLVSHPNGVQQVLTGGTAYTTGTRFYQEIAAYFGDGVLTSDGQRWRRQRSTLAPLFTHRRTGHHVAVMAAEAERLVQRWRAAAGPPTQVDLHGELTKNTRCGWLAGSCSAPTSRTRSP